MKAPGRLCTDVSVLQPRRLTGIKTTGAFIYLILLPLFLQASESEYNDRFCAEINGERETRLYYTYSGGRSYVLVDCETATHVWEGGLDKRSSLDSIQQALFFSVISGKRPAVVIYDTDGFFGRYEHRIETACKKAGVKFRRYR